MSKIYHARSQNIRKMHFWGTSGCWMGIICLHTPSKSSLVIILRCQSSFYNHRSMRYGLWDIFAQPGLFPANQSWPKIWHLFFLTLLKRKWIYMEVHTGDNSAPRGKVFFDKTQFWHYGIGPLFWSLSNIFECSTMS